MANKKAMKVEEPRASTATARESTNRLLKAALESFSELGYHGTTTRDIAAKAGLSPAALYVYYESKAQILFLLIRRTHEELLDLLEQAADPQSDPAERLSSLVTAHVGFHAHRAMEARVANHELPALSPGDIRVVMRLRRRIEQLFVSAIEEGIAAGLFRKRDIKATTFAILSLGIGVSRWFKQRGSLSPDQLGAAYAELVRDMVGGGPR